MKNLSIIAISITLLIFLTSCGFIKEGLGSSKKDNNDEFLVEKKMPLKMPPKYNELPKPGKTNQSRIEGDNEIKIMISNSENKNVNQAQNKKVNKKLKETLLEKIEQN